MTSLPPGKLDQTKAHVRDIGRRIERRVEPRRTSDFELRQLRSLMRAYSTPAGPDVLFIGDSLMHRAAKEPDRRRTFDMISDALGAHVRCLTVAGPSYNVRMAMAYLSAFRACQSQPRVVVVPLTTVTLMPVFLDHPQRGAARAAAAVRSAVDAWPDLPKTYDKPGQEDWAAFDQLTAPSRIGQTRTMGELELFINSSSRSSSQATTRLRHIMDSYTAEMFEPQSPGIKLVAEMGRVIRRMNLPAVAYLAAVNYELAEQLLGPGTRDHIARNARVVETAFLESAGDLGMVVNQSVASSEAEFGDSLHLNHQGRHRLARGIADTVEAQLHSVGRPRHARVPINR